MLRRPVVADRFYPGNPADLEKFLSDTMDFGIGNRKTEALAIVSPHAGYVYSGGVAGQTVAGVVVPETVVILGPNHHGRGAVLALGADDWSMPLGTVPVEQELAGKILARSSVIVHDETAHFAEHSLEVQIPFLQHVQDRLSIVPIVVSHVPYNVCVQAAEDISSAIREFGRPVLLVASTDMTHYESRKEAAVKDRMALEKLQQLDPAGLYETVLQNRISMCGIMPTVITLLAVMNLGAQKVDLICYTDSGAVSGDINQVVGYAGLVIS
jgi:hypothetical protein